MNCEIMIRSYRKDLVWCEYAIRSIEKRCSGFSGVTILVSTQDETLFRKFESRRTKDGAPVRVQAYPSHPGKEMLACIGELCFADEYCPEADMILHTDSDCVFTRPVTPETYLINGLPQLLYRTYDWLDREKLPMYCWKKPTDAALGMNVQYETMARHPGVFWSCLYESLRERVEGVHHLPFMDYVLSFENKFPWGFAEFPALGAWAMHDAPECYYPIDVTGVSETDIGRQFKQTLHQGWTHFDYNNPGSVAQAEQQKRLFERLLSK